VNRRKAFFCFIMVAGVTLAAKSALAEDATSTATRAGPADDPLGRITAILGLAEKEVRPGSPADGTSPAEVAVDALVKLGLKTHPDRTRADAVRAAGDAALTEAAARFQPTLGLSAGVSRMSSLRGADETSLTSTPSPNARSSDTSRQVGLSLRQNLFSGGADMKGLSAARVAGERSEIEATVLGLTREWRIRRAAHACNAAAMRLILADAAEKGVAELRVLSERKRAAGLAGRLDIMETALRETENAASTARVRAELDATHIELASAIGSADVAQPEFQQLIKSLESLALPLPSAPPAAQGAQGEPVSVEVRIAEARAREAELRVDALRSRRWIPRVDLTGSVGRSVSESDGGSDRARELVGAGSTSSSWSQNSQLALELSWDIWSRSTDASIREAAATSATAAAATAETRSNNAAARQIVASRIAMFRASEQSYASTWKQTDALHAAKRELYRAGAIDIFELLAADAKRIDALSRWFDARANLRLELIREQFVARGITAE